MNKLINTVAIIALTSSSIAFANSSDTFFAGDNTTSTKICMVAIAGNKLKLHETIKDAGLSKRYVAEQIKCNQQDLVTFVEQHGKNADKINNYLSHGAYSQNTDLTASAAH